MDQEYIDLLKAERAKLVKEHTQLFIQGYPTLAGPRWKAVKRLNRAIARAERPSRSKT